MAKRTVKRSAQTGQFVTKKEWKANPDTTVRERRRHWRTELSSLAATWREKADDTDSETAMALRMCADDVESLIERVR